MAIFFDPFSGGSSILSDGIPSLSIKSMEREMFGPVFMGASSSEIGASIYASPFFEPRPIGALAPVGVNRFAETSPFGLSGVGFTDYVSQFIDAAKSYRDRDAPRMPEYGYSVFNDISRPERAEEPEDPHAEHKKEAADEAPDAAPVDEVEAIDATEEPDYIKTIRDFPPGDGKDIDHPIIEVTVGDDKLYHIRYRYAADLDVEKINDKELKKLVTNLQTFIKEHPDVIFELGNHRFYAGGNAPTWAGLTTASFKAQIPQSF